MRSIKSFIYSTLCNLPQFVDCLINRNENAIHKCFFLQNVNCCGWNVNSSL